MLVYLTFILTYLMVGHLYYGIDTTTLLLFQPALPELDSKLCIRYIFLSLDEDT